SGRHHEGACLRPPNLQVFGLQTHCTATGVQTRQNADHSFAGYTYTNRQALEGARCSPQNLGERGREGPQQTGGSCGTSSSEPSTACRTRAGSSNPSSIASVPSLQRALLRPSEPLGARAVEKVRARREGACEGWGVLKSHKPLHGCRTVTCCPSGGNH